MKVISPTANGSFVFPAAVLPLDVPLLLGLDTMFQMKLDICPTDLTIRCNRDGTIYPLVYDGHLVLRWSPKDPCHFYTKVQLRRLHRHFIHPSATKLHELLRKAKPEEMNDNTRKLIEEISRSCETCQEINRRPISFSVRTPNDIIFNQELLLDITYYKGRPILHIIDRGTRFSAARYLPKADALTVWNAFVKAWSFCYVGHPQNMLTDQGSVFMSSELKGMCKAANIHLRNTRIESHNSLHVGESLHAGVHQILRRLELDHPDLGSELSLSIAVHVMNITVKAEGLCPMLLVFGVTPTIPDVAKVLLSHVERIKAMHAARDEFSKTVAKQRVNRAIQSRLSATSDSDATTGDMVYVYREWQKKWVGPVPCIYRDGKKIILSINCIPKSFNVSQIKKANIEDPNPHHSVHLTEIVTNDDRRASMFTDAKRKEILGLIERGTFAIVLRPETDEKLNTLPFRFVLAIKSREDGAEILKARFVIGVHRDLWKSSLVHISNDVKHTSIRLLIALAAILGFDVWSSDIRQAYLQSMSPLPRDVYVRPPSDILELGPNELLKLLKPLYGLSDAGDYWAETLNAFHIRKLRMKQATGDFALFFRKIMDKLVGLSATFVDDMLEAGTPAYRRMLQKSLSDEFDMAPPQTTPLVYAGSLVTSNSYTISQEQYVSKLQLLDEDASFEKFASYRQKVAWLVNSRPDIACVASFAAQVTVNTYVQDDIKAINETVMHLKSTKAVRFKFPKLDQESLHLVVYADSSSANHADGRTQLGYIIALAYKEKMQRNRV